jgi:IS1 family transposase
MNRLPLNKRVQILTMLCEGSSMHSIARVVDVSRDSVAKLLVDAGFACQAFHDQTVRGLKNRQVECDEIWSFCYSKSKNTPKESDTAGSIWTWTALDVDSRLIVSWHVGKRTREHGYVFMDDLASRVDGRTRIATDGLRAYADAVNMSFGRDTDYAQLVKVYGDDIKGYKGRPSDCVGIYKAAISGKPTHFSTSYVERQNLTMRQSMRRFSRKTLAFSKKLENHCHALALYFVFYNFVRMHGSLRMTPAMAAGLTDKLWDMADIVNMVDEREARLKLSN